MEGQDWRRKQRPASSRQTSEPVSSHVLLDMTRELANALQGGLAVALTYSFKDPSPKCAEEASHASSLSTCSITSMASSRVVGG